MARPRRQQRSLDAGETDIRATPPRREAYVEETPEEARLADFLVALVGRHLLDTMDPTAPNMDKYWEWKAQQARDALTPQERVELRREAEEFARRMKVEFEALDRAETNGDRTPDRTLDVD